MTAVAPKPAGLMDALREFLRLEAAGGIVLALAALLEPVTLGILLGLVLGKQLGVFGALYLAVKSGLGRMPEGANWPQVYGLALLCGIGFTMSLFIGGIAFDDPMRGVQVRLGVLGGSIVAALAGAAMLLRGRAIGAAPPGAKTTSPSGRPRTP